MDLQKLNMCGTQESVVLVLGTKDDILVSHVVEALESKERVLRTLGEQELFANTPFAYHAGKKLISGFLQIDGTKILLSDVSGVFVRIPRSWWPASGLDTQDQAFVYHETLASWIGLFTNLDCPVINRFEIEWWLREETYNDFLRHSMARFVGLSHGNFYRQRSPAELSQADFNGQGTSSSSIYIVGDELLPASESSGKLVWHMERRRSALRNWRNATGVEFCRVDCLCGDELALTTVDAFPLLDDEQPDVIQRIGTSVVDLLE